jgi:hypothetical protein
VAQTEQPVFAQLCSAFLQNIEKYLESLETFAAFDE